MLWLLNIFNNYTIQDSLNKINKTYDFNKIILMGDKGYITNNNYYYNNKKVNLLTYKKKFKYKMKKK